MNNSRYPGLPTATCNGHTWTTAESFDPELKIPRPQPENEAGTSIRETTDTSLPGGSTLSALERPDAPTLVPPDLIYIHSVVATGAANGGTQVKRHHERRAAAEYAEQVHALREAVKAGTIHCQALAGNIQRLRQELRKLAPRQFLDITQVAGAWSLLDRGLFAGLSLIVVLLLGADWWNARTLLKCSGVPEFLDSELAALCASAGAVMLAVALKVLASTCTQRSGVRCAALLIPGICLLALWMVLTSLAFPGYAADSSVGELEDVHATSAGSGLAMPWSGLLQIASCLGFAVSAAGISCYAEDLYRKHYGTRREVNPQYATTEAALNEAIALHEQQAVRLGRCRGLLEGIALLQEQSVALALVLYEAQRAQAGVRGSSSLKWLLPSFFRR